MEITTILWRRLDTPGHDACHLIHLEDGWVLEGAAVFEQDGFPACLAYQVDCDSAWHTREGVVHGWLGSSPLDIRITRNPSGLWTFNGQAVTDLEDCVDLDLGFTPATNLFQIRRAALEIGQSADVPVAWFDPSAGNLQRLYQRYERRTAETYWYESPSFDYSAILHISEAGFVTKYPDLWEAELWYDA
jgi:hypothetical protein